MSDPSRAEQDVYGFAPDDRVNVSPASACTTTLTGDKKQAVRSYLTKLGPALHRRHGKQAHYSPLQVRDSVHTLGLSVDWVCWAYMLHCSVTDFALLHTAVGEECDRSAMWTAVSTEFFNGSQDFDPAVLAEVVNGAESVASSGGWLIDWTDLFGCDWFG